MSQWSAPWNAPKVQVDTAIEPIVEVVAPTQTTTPEPEIKAALRLTDAQMAKYVLSQRFVDGRWVSPIVLEGHGKNGPAIDAYVET